MTGEFDVCLHGKRLNIGGAARDPAGAHGPESAALKRETRELTRYRPCTARALVYTSVLTLCVVTNALDFAVSPVYSAGALSLALVLASPGVMCYYAWAEPQGHSKTVLAHMLALHSLALVGLLSPPDWRLTTTNPVVTQAAIFAVVLHALTLRVGGAPQASACTQMAHWAAYSSLFATSLVLRGVGGLDAGVRLSDSVFVVVSLVYYDYSLNVAK